MKLVGEIDFHFIMNASRRMYPCTTWISNKSYLKIRLPAFPRLRCPLDTRGLSPTPSQPPLFSCNACVLTSLKQVARGSGCAVPGPQEHPSHTDNLHKLIPRIEKATWPVASWHWMGIPAPNPVGRFWVSDQVTWTLSLQL